MTHINTNMEVLKLLPVVAFVRVCISAFLECPPPSPPSLYYTGSMVFNDGGRFQEGGDWFKMMYGAFSGPTLGPTGTAICAYHADNTVGTGGQSNFGIFDIFFSDIVVAVDSDEDEERVNEFVRVHIYKCMCGVYVQEIHVHGCDCEI